MVQEARRPASPALAPFVSWIGYYQGRFAHARERTLATGGMQLLVNLADDELWWHPDGAAEGQRTAGAAVQGPDSRPGVVDPAHQRAIVWVAFRPGGAWPFLPLPASELRDQLVGLADLWGPDGVSLRERLLAAPSPAGKLRVVEAALLARVVRPLAPDPAVAVAAAALHRGATVAKVSDRLGWPRQRLTRHFVERIGLTPKRFARVRRFQRLLGSVTAGGGYGHSGVDWARLAAESGYHDQAHMIHDFHTFAGMCPTAYVPRSPAEQNHVPL
jgi:AraC-like DNA-binding protein